MSLVFQGLRGQRGPARAQVDRELDAATPNAGEMMMEKMVSGMYMGEVARRLLLRLAVRRPARSLKHPNPSTLAQYPSPGTLTMAVVFSWCAAQAGGGDAVSAGAPRFTEPWPRVQADE